jgi:hypothetical protein
VRHSTTNDQLSAAIRRGTDLDLRGKAADLRSFTPDGLADSFRVKRDVLAPRKGPVLAGLIVKRSGEKPLDLEAESLDFNLHFENCEFHCPILLADAVARSITFTQCIFHAPLNAERLRCTKLTFLGGEFRSSSLWNLKSLVSGEDLTFGGGFRLAGTVLLHGAEIGGRLVMDGARLTHPDVSLNADGMSVKSDVLLSNGFEAAGTVILRGARIGDRLVMDGARLTHPDVSLNADGMSVKSDVLLSNGFEAAGTVILRGAHVGDRLVMRRSRLSHPDVALNGEDMTVQSGVFLDEGFEAQGTTRLPGANIGGQLVMRGAILHHRHVALNAARIIVKSDVFLNEGFDAVGTIRFRRSLVGGTMYMCPNRPLRMDAPGANWSSLQDSPHSWAPESDTSGLTFSVASVEGDWKVDERIAWLQSLTFSRSTWLQTERIYREHGKREAANNVAIALRNRDRRNRKSLWSLFVRNPLDWLLEALSGYGYRPLRCVTALLALVFAVYLPLAIPFGRDTMVASTSFGPTFTAGGQRTEELSLTAARYSDRCGDGTVTCFNAFLFAIDTVLPFVDLQQTDTWHPDRHRGAKSPNWYGNQHLQAGAILAWYLPLASLLGWAFSTIALLTITRLGNRPGLSGSLCK